MTDDHRLEGPGENGVPIPRDLPDQLAGAADDPWEAPSGAGREPESHEGDEEDDEEAPETATDVPDTDEAGTGRQGAPNPGTVHPEHPVPDESPG
ncbi:hypothetical protein ACGFZL_15860 [Streptomyces sp. NPDC048182]|uniref:hypothetical protein n=1 Tax=unclassified Streptomyces TaxID=2593676 RepID=UPI0033BECE4D